MAGAAKVNVGKTCEQFWKILADAGNRCRPASVQAGMGTKLDRENASALAAWEERKAELRGLIVDTRTLTRAGLSAVTERAADYVELDPVIFFPREKWATLKYHERRWLEVEAAARSSRGAVLVGRSAARKLGMWVVSRTAEAVELTLPSRSNSPRRTKSRGFTFRYSEVSADELLTYEGHRVTDPVRTFIDIARYHGFVEGLIAADYLMRRGKTRGEIERGIRRMGRCKGLATARRCLHHAIATSQSPYESFVRALLIEAGIGPVAAQFQVDGWFVDLCVDGWLLIEIDGELKYEGPDGEAAWRAEKDREKRISNKGFKFLRFSPEFIRKHPDLVVQEVRDALASRDLLIRRMG